VKPSIFSIISFTLSLSGILAPRVHAKQGLDRIVAVVSDHPILESEALKRLSEIKSSPSLAAVYGLNPASAVYADVYQQMLEEKIIEVSVAELKLTVSDAEVESQIGKIASQNRVDRRALEASLRREGISLEIYRKNIRSQMERRNLFDRELRGAGGVSEVELRALYEKSAPIEFDVSLVPNSKSLSTSSIEKVRVEGKLKAFVEEQKGSDLGWIGLDSLTPALKKALSGAESGEIRGPIVLSGKSAWVVVHSKRRGSEEGFAKERDRLGAELQAQDFERRLSQWMERRKKELQIVENK
jgi:peptidyl-prolyl cis-trans isomerase SurA